MIADIEANKKLSQIVTGLFLRGRRLNISLAFISQSYFKVPKTITKKYFTKENFDRQHRIIRLMLSRKNFSKNTCLGQLTD